MSKISHPNQTSKICHILTNISGLGAYFWKQIFEWKPWVREYHEHHNENNFFFTYKGVRAILSVISLSENDPNLTFWVQILVIYMGHIHTRLIKGSGQNHVAHCGRSRWLRKKLKISTWLYNYISNNIYFRQNYLTAFCQNGTPYWWWVLPLDGPPHPTILASPAPTVQILFYQCVLIMLWLIPHTNPRGQITIKASDRFVRY